MIVLEGNVFKSDQKFNAEPSFNSLGHYIIDRLSNKHPTKVLFVDATTDEEWTGLRMRDKILEFAQALIVKYGLKPQDTVCICCDHSMYGVILALAVICAGGIVAYSYHKDPYAELLYLARKIEPKFLVCYEKDISWVKQLEIDLCYKIVRIEIMQDTDFDSNCMSGAETNLPVELPVECKNIETEIAFITMSSGTTGRPKAIPVTHKVCLVDQLLIALKNPYQLQTIAAFTSTFDYVSGRLLLFAALESGFKAIILNFSTVDEYCRMVEKYGITLAYLGLTTFYNFITSKNTENYNLSTINALIPMGGKLVYLDEFRKFLKSHPQIVRSRITYGSSETSIVASEKVIIPYDLEKFASNNCGQLEPCVEVVLKHPETGKLVGKNETGLVFVKSPALFSGYYDVQLLKHHNGNRNEMHASPFTSEMDENGFYPTGDLAYFSDEGDLFVLGRQKELMNCRLGKKVLPSELEDMFIEHPSVSKVCVLGIESKLEKSLHCPRAYICVKAHHFENQIKQPNPTEPASDEPAYYKFKGSAILCSLPTEMRHTICKELMKFANERVGWEKQITGGIVLLDDLPSLRSSGKPDKVQLRSLTLEQVEIYGDFSC